MNVFFQTKYLMNIWMMKTNLHKYDSKVKGISHSYLSMHSKGQSKASKWIWNLVSSFVWGYSVIGAVENRTWSPDPHSRSDFFCMDWPSMQKRPSSVLTLPILSATSKNKNSTIITLCSHQCQVWIRAFLGAQMIRDIIKSFKHHRSAWATLTPLSSHWLGLFLQRENPRGRCT